jgi:unsaturated chondroitin disaccharide hydrolase
MPDRPYQAKLERALASLCRGADVVCEDIATTRGVPRLNYLTGAYACDDAYIHDSWADFQWAGFLAGRLWLLHLLHLLTKQQRYADAAMAICEHIGPVLAKHPTVFSSVGIDLYYALTLGYRITGRPLLKDWVFAGGDNFANIFDGKADALLDPETREVTRLFSLQGWKDDSVWARGQAWAMLDFAHGYEASGNPIYLDAAMRAADWYADNAPPGLVPRYDYHDPERDTLPYDSCAACIAAAQLLRLARWLPDRAARYETLARQTIDVLIDNFLTVGGVVLHGSWGRMRHAEPGKPRLGRFPQDDIMPYGNYWIAECLYRELNRNWSVLALA